MRWVKTILTRKKLEMEYSYYMPDVTRKASDFFLINSNKKQEKIKWIDTKIKGKPNTKNKECIIAIPVYKKKIDKYEIASLKQCVKIFKDNYNILLICPSNLNIQYYSELADYNFLTLECNPKYFKSQRGYSDLCEVPQFYKCFDKYKYLTIYQLDAWVFRDDIKYFIDLNYDYIGAPHLLSDINKEGENGNGGFSLRRIKKFYEICSEVSFDNIEYLEDCAFTKIFKNYFNLAPMNICRQFSFQDEPSKNFKMANNKLPMGCHAFKKYEFDNFWNKYIKI